MVVAHRITVCGEMVVTLHKRMRVLPVFKKGFVHAAMLQCMTHLVLVLPCRLSMFGHLASFRLYSFEPHTMATNNRPLVGQRCACLTINMLMSNAVLMICCH